MPQIKGQIKRAKKGKQRSIYLSDKFGIWTEGSQAHS